MVPGLHPPRRSRGMSYLEVCLAFVILSLCLIPAAKALPTIMATQKRVETRYRLSLVAQRELENAVLNLEARFSASTSTGRMTPIGHPEWRYSLVVDLPSGDGRYAVVTATAWEETDGDDQPSQGETQVTFATIVANRNWTP